MSVRSFVHVLSESTHQLIWVQNGPEDFNCWCWYLSLWWSKSCKREGCRGSGEFSGGGRKECDSDFCLYWEDEVRSYNYRCFLNFLTLSLVQWSSDRVRERVRETGVRWFQGSTSVFSGYTKTKTTAKLFLFPEGGDNRTGSEPKECLLRPRHQYYYIYC